MYFSVLLLALHSMLLFCRYVVSNSLRGLRAHQAPLDFSFPEKNRSRFPFASPGDVPNTGIEPVSPTFADGFFTTEPPGKPFHSIPSCRWVPKLPSYNADLTSSLWSSDFLEVNPNCLDATNLSFFFFFFPCKSYLLTSLFPWFLALNISGFS